MSMLVQGREKRLYGILRTMNCKIHHIGSIAIAFIQARPIIYILIEIPANCPRTGAKIF